MTKVRQFLMLIAAATALIVTGCQQSQNPVEPMGGSDQNQSQKLTIPIGAVVDSAVIYVWVSDANNEEITVHGITAPWDENDVTWNNFGASYNIGSEDSFTPDAPGWYSANVTDLAASWVDSTFGQNGVLLKEESPAVMQQIFSRETGYDPYMLLFWSYGGTSGYDSIRTIRDTYISSGEPDANYGDSTSLYTGWMETIETQILLGFRIVQVPPPPPPSGGCTKGYGYWKTHSAYGPASYDSVWALLGEDSTFYLSQQTNYEVMWTSPKHGNAYYMLAHAFISVELNFLAGADPTDVQEAFDNAVELFDTYTPEDIGSLHGNDPLRMMFISLKNTLEEYNSGEIGPGPCQYFASLKTNSRK